MIIGGIYFKEIRKIVRGRTKERRSINIPPSRSFLNRVEIFIAECRRDRAASSHELQASLVFVGAFESRVDRRRSFAGAARRSLLDCIGVRHRQ